jgi:hypothetical protein
MIAIRFPAVACSQVTAEAAVKVSNLPGQPQKIYRTEQVSLDVAGTA